MSRIPDLSVVNTILNNRWNQSAVEQEFLAQGKKLEAKILTSDEIAASRWEKFSVFKSFPCSKELIPPVTEYKTDFLPLDSSSTKEKIERGISIDFNPNENWNFIPLDLQHKFISTCSAYKFRSCSLIHNELDLKQFRNSESLRQCCYYFMRSVYSKFISQCKQINLLAKRSHTQLIKDINNLRKQIPDGEPIYLIIDNQLFNYFNMINPETNYWEELQAYVYPDYSDFKDFESLIIAPCQVKTSFSFEIKTEAEKIPYKLRVKEFCLFSFGLEVSTENLPQEITILEKQEDANLKRWRKF